MASIFIRTLIIYLILLISIKLMGKREIGELDVSELVSTLMISEIAAIPIDDPDIPLLNAIIPILLILSAEIILSYLKNRFSRIKKYVEGQPSYIIYKGRIIQESLIENRISINELLAEMRAQGIGDISRVDYALVEHNGRISILEDKKTAHSIIIDGEVNRDEAERAGLSDMDIAEILRQSGIDLCRVFLMTRDDGGKIKIIPKEDI